MATGHGVQQIPETSAVQQQQQSTLSPIEQRLVAEHQSAATASFAGAEPTETDRPEPAAPFADAPAVVEPMEIETGLAAEEIPLEDVISNFLPHHQEDIRECLNFKDVQQMLDVVRSFLKILKNNGIKLTPGRGKIPTPSLFGRLWKISVTKDAELIRKFFEKATIFFSAVIPAQTKNTSCLSSMLNSKTHIREFADLDENNLRLLAGNPHLKQITSMCDRQGVPDPIQAVAMVEWECWKTNGIFNHELLRTFASMRSGRGLFEDEAEITTILAWPCWRVDGAFSMELLRTVSSMMCRKGFPDKAKLEALLAWDCWKIDGKFSLEMLRIFSSMKTSRGLLDNEAQVQVILAWDCWKIDGKFSFELLRTFSSMHHTKGLFKDQNQIKAILAWPCWQVNGKFSPQLLRTFASMMNGRGLFDRAQVEQILVWDCWQLNGEFSLELLRTFSSMMHGQGLFDDDAQIQAILAWDCWKIDGKFSFELLRTFCYMHTCKGLLKDQDQNRIKDVLAWPCWQVDNEFSLELLRTIASMMNGRGLFDKAQVEQILSWPCLEIDGRFSLEMLRIFSSMKTSQGLLDNEAQLQAILAWDCWKIDGKFSFELLRTFSTMHHGKGLFKDQDQNQIKAILAWPCWQVKDNFSMELLRIFSSMMNGHGLFDDEAPIREILAWDCWQVDGKFSLPLLRTIASMMASRGLLKKAPVEQFMSWLPSDHTTRYKQQTCLKVACQLFIRAGLPDPKILSDIEAILRRYIPEEAITSDEEESSDSEDEPQEMVQLKALTLFCAAPEKWRTSIAEIEQFLVAYNIAHQGPKAVGAILDSLLRILVNHGQAGLRFWLKYYSDTPDRKHTLTRALLLSAPLAHTKYALTQLPESEWPEYIELCKNITPALNKDQWQALKPLRDLLQRRFTLTLRKRMMLEILWPQSEHNRLRYAEKLDTLLNTVPTIYQLYRLHQAFKPQKLQAFLDACLARENMAGQSIKETVPEIKTQELLLEGLLLTNHYLSEHGQIPDLCFSKQVAGADGSGVIVDGDAEMSGPQRLWHFIAAMLIELKQTEYQFKRQQLRISPPDSETIILPKPEFTAAYTGFVITNWSLEQLTAFFRATEFTEHWYKNPDDTRDICVIRSEQRLLQTRARPQNITQTGYKAGHNSFRSLLSPSVIINIIKQGIRLKPAVWSSLEHYAKNGQLSDTLCRLLAPIIEKKLASTAPDAIPEIVKKTVAERLRQTGTSQTAAVATATQLPSSTSTFAATPSSNASPLVSPSQMLLATDIAIDMALDTMARDMAIEELEHFPVLGRAELDILEPWRDQMTYSQLMDVMTKIDLQSVEQETILTWQQTFEKRRRDHLGLDLDEFLDSLLEGADD